MRVLITGILGFVGCHLAEHLIAEGCEVWGVTRSYNKRKNISPFEKNIHLVEGDLLDQRTTDRLIEDCAPDVVFHFAGESVVGGSWEHALDTISTNINCQVNLLESIRRTGSAALVVIPGSSEEYGKIDSMDIPVTETVGFKPVNPYGVSKVAQDLIGYQYFASFAIPIIRIRSFTLIGPKQTDNFAVSSFSKQLAEVSLGMRRPLIKVGNLAPKKDWLDVRDAARGYWLAAQHGLPGEVYNLCSGRSSSVQEILDSLVSIVNVNVQISVDNSRLRPVDVADIIGDPRKLTRATGWVPQIPLDTTLRDTLEYWLSEIKSMRND